jgi:hypothetical protein
MLSQNQNKSVAVVKIVIFPGVVKYIADANK